MLLTAVKERVRRIRKGMFYSEKKSFGGRHEGIPGREEVEGNVESLSEVDILDPGWESVTWPRAC